ncbi:Gfo/Idh/MocA family oxidoreductase [Streptomyces netropsis]|uniref:Gfo/Idh/MocA family protein n=1 Tax=Streptomyces netropsis TaxID=55404 RepID=UPI0030D09F05
MRWGVAGYGDVVTRRVLPALAESGEVVAYVWGRDAGRAARTAAAHGAAGGGDDTDRLFTGVDAVYVATPVIAHVPLAARALGAGRHVLVEKPLAGALGGGAVLAAQALAARRCAGVAYYRRLGPAARWLRSALRDGASRIRVDFRAPFDPGPEHPMRWRTDPAVAGGGVLADAGSHRLDLLLGALGRPTRVGSRVDRRFAAGCERRARLTLEWPSGVTAECRFEWAEGAVRDRFEAVAAGRSYARDPLDAGAVPNPHVPLIADFVTAAGEGRAPVCPVAEAALVDEVIAAALA